MSDIYNLEMNAITPDTDGVYTYAGNLPCPTSGRRGYTVRVLPYHRSLGVYLESGMVEWAGI